MGKDIEEELRKVMAGNASLLHELDHRVNNNQQLMESLVKLQMSTLTDPIAREALRATQRALHALSVSNGLFMDRIDARKLDLASLMRSLTDRLAYSLDASPREIEIALSGKAVDIETRFVVPLGLVTGEILARALDRARDRQGKIRIAISWKTGNAGELWLKYRDDGGCMAEEALRGLRDTLGLLLAGVPADHLRATLTISSEGKGTTIIVGLSPFAPE